MLQGVLTFASKHTPCLNTSSLCMGILKSCASSTKLYLVTPGIALSIADSLQQNRSSGLAPVLLFAGSVMEKATYWYAHLLVVHSPLSLERRVTPEVNRVEAGGLVGLVDTINVLISDRCEHSLNSAKERRRGSTHAPRPPPPGSGWRTDLNTWYFSSKRRCINLGTKWSQWAINIQEKGSPISQ